MRGGAKPVSDRPVSLPAVADQGPGPDQAPLCLPDTADLLDTDSDESDIDQRDVPSEDTAVPLVQMKSSDCIFLLNVSSNIAHVAAGCEANDPFCIVTTDDGFVQKSFKFACNVG